MRRSALAALLASLSFWTSLPFLPAPAAAQSGPPVVSGIRVAAESPREGDPVTLEATVRNPAGAALAFTWDPGDGSEPRTGSGLSSIVHAFRDSGTFTVGVTVDDGAGGVARGAATVTVGNAAPEILVLTGPAEAGLDEPVELQAVARDPGVDDVLTYRWTFGGGGTAEGVDLGTVTHRFPEPGLHTVELTVEDGDGGIVTRTLLVPVERTHEFELSGRVSGTIAGGFEERPGFTAITRESSREVPAGMCLLTVTATGSAGDMVIVGGMVPTPVEPSTFEVRPAHQGTPGSFAVQDMLRCDRPGVDCGAGLWRGMGQGGSVTLTHVGPDRVEGRVDASMTYRRQGYQLSGTFTAAPSTVFGQAIARGEGTCFPAGRFVVERVTPEPEAENVDPEEGEVRVTLSSPYDPGTLNPSTFRLEYRTRDPLGLTGSTTESFAALDGVLEPTGERTFRFVPAEPLPDGIILRATVVGGPNGLRGAGGEQLEDDRSWRFSTLVEPEDVRLAAFQVARNAPLVPGKPTLTRVYVDWREKDLVHPDWQVTRFTARVEVEEGGQAPYPSQEVTVRRPDLFTPLDSVHARNSINFFGWRPRGTGGSSTLSATIEPLGQDRPTPRRFRSGELTLDHHTASPSLVLEARTMRVGPWEEGVPPALRQLNARILEEGSVFTEQNFPVVSVRGRLEELAVEEPFMLTRTQGPQEGREGLEIYSDLFGAVKRDEYLARKAHDLMLYSRPADLFLLFFPSWVQPQLGGYRYEFPTPTVGIMIPEEPGASTLGRSIGTVAHEIGHAFGLPHLSACAYGAYQECLYRGKEGSDEIEGFRLARDGNGGSNKSKTEGNAEAEATHAVLSLMYPQGIGSEALFVMNEQYAQLLAHPRLAAAEPPSGPPGREPGRRWAGAEGEPWLAAEADATRLSGLRGDGGPVRAELPVDDGFAGQGGVAGDGGFSADAGFPWNGPSPREAGLRGTGLGYGEAGFGPNDLRSREAGFRRNDLRHTAAFQNGGFKVDSGGQAGTSAPRTSLRRGNPPPADDNPAVQEAGWLLVSGLILPGGAEAALDPVQRFPRDPLAGVGGASGASGTGRIPDGDHTLEVLDAAGALLNTVPFGTTPTAPVHATDLEGRLLDDPEPGPSDPRWFWVAAPDSPDAAAVVVKRGDRVLMRLDRSPSAPEVRFLDVAPRPAAPAGADAPLRIRWEGNDADGDPVAYALFFSPDGEEDWRGLTSLWTRTTEMELDPALRGEGPRPTLRILVTDGFRQGEARMELGGG